MSASLSSGDVIYFVYKDINSHHDRRLDLLSAIDKIEQFFYYNTYSFVPT